MIVSEAAMRAFGIEEDPPKVTPISMRERTERQRREAAADPEQIPALLERYFGFGDVQPFHLDLFQRCFRGGKHIVNWPTDHRKSRVSSFEFPVLSLMNDPDQAHIIVGANVADSKRYLQQMQFEFENNVALIHDYPWIAKPKAKENRIWAATQFNVAGRSRNSPNPSVFVAGAGSSSIYQRRGKLILDDTEGPDHRYSPWQRQKLYDFIKLAGMRCYEDRAESERPLLVALGTPWYSDSVYFELEGEGWEVSRVRVYLDPDREDGNTSPKLRQLVWEAKREKVEEQWQKMNREQFAISYLMDPSGGDKSKMSYQQIAELATGGDFEMPEQSITLVSLDPASGSTVRRADYAGLSVVKIVWKMGEALPLVDVMEAHKVTQGIYEQVGFATRLAQEYGCRIIYETNSQQGNNYRDVWQRTHPEIIADNRLIGHHTTAKMKMDETLGLTVLRTLLRKSQIRVPGHLLESEGVRALLNEIKDLGVGPQGHDHIAASVWFVIRHAAEQSRLGQTYRSTLGPRRFGEGGALNWRNWRRAV